MAFYNLPFEEGVLLQYLNPSGLLWCFASWQNVVSNSIECSKEFVISLK